MAWRWPGSRGEGYVAVQAGLLLLVLLGPSLHSHWAWPQPWGGLAAGLSLLCWAWAGVFGAYGLASLGRNLSVLPRPKDDAQLVTQGAYAWVRHPIYSGVLALCLAWSLGTQSGPSLLASAALALLFDRKARREEAWLAERFAAYEASA